MIDLSTKSCLIYDERTFVSFAERLAKEFGKVMYFSPWQSAFPQLKYSLIGTGLDNVERVDNFFDHVPEADMIAFTDVLNADLQIHLQELGKPVWGGRRGDQVELDRVGIMEFMESKGLPVIPYKVITGMDNLRKYLKSNKNIWVKCDIYRGSFETFQSVNYDYISMELNKIERKLGGWKNKQKFICQKDTPDCVELGIDTICIDGKYLDNTICGLEVKNLGYIGMMKPHKKLPEPVLQFVDAIAPHMKGWGYKQHFSDEVRINRKGEGFMSDATCRIPSPPGDLMMKMFTNYPQIVWGGAHGECVEPIPENKFGVELTIKSTDAEEGQLPVQFPEKHKDNITLTSCMKVDGTYYVIPGEVPTPYIGSIITTGDTLEDACDKAEEIADSVRASYIEIPFDALKKAQDELDKLKEFGYNIFK